MPTISNDTGRDPEGFVRRFLTRPLAIDSSAVEAVASMTAVRRSHEVREVLLGERFSRLDNGVAHLHVAGPLSWGEPFVALCCGFADWELIIDALASVETDPDIRTLVVEIDSPGGDVRGMDDACAAVRRVRAAGKRVVMAARSWAMSAAYVFAAQGDELVVTPGASVGALGVYVPYEDSSEHYKQNGFTRGLLGSSKSKGINSDGVPTTPEMLEAERAWVAELESVAMAMTIAGRGVSESVYAGWRDGPKRVGAGAVAVGMADRVAEFEDLLDELTGVSGAPEDAEMATPRQLQSRAGHATGGPAARTPALSNRAAPAPKAQTMTADELREKYPEAVAEIEAAVVPEEKPEETPGAEATPPEKPDEKPAEKPEASGGSAAPQASEAGNLAAITAAIGERTQTAMAFAAEASIDRLTPAQAKAQWARLKQATAVAHAAAAGGSAEPAPAAPRGESTAGGDYMDVVRTVAKAENLPMAKAVAKVNRERPELRLAYTGRAG